MGLSQTARTSDGIYGKWTYYRALSEGTWRYIVELGDGTFCVSLGAPIGKQGCTGLRTQTQV
jgi:hypothetical protein